MSERVYPLDNDYNPEKEYTKIKNEILDALGRRQMSGHEWRIFIVLARKTWGWRKKYDWVARGKLADATGLDRQNAYRALRGLFLKKVVLKADGKPYGPKLYGINMRFWEWQLSSEMTTSREMRPEDVVEFDLPMSSEMTTNPPKMSAQMTPTKNNPYKEIKNKEQVLMDSFKIEDQTEDALERRREEGRPHAKAARKWIEENFT